MSLEDNSKLITCRVCGAIMVRLARDICPKCFQEEEKVFHKVRDFLRTNPGASIEDVAKHTSATVVQVEAFIRSGRLERVGVKRVAHPCQLCQKTIYEGVVCSDCRKNLKEQVTSLKPSEKEKLDPASKSDVPVTDKRSSDGGHVGKRQR